MTSARVVAALAAGLTLTGGALHAVESAGFSVGGRAATLGFRLELTKAVTPRFNLRAGGSLLNYRYNPGFDVDLSYRGMGAKVHFEPELRLRELDLLADVYPAGSGFHVSGGLVYNRSKAYAVSDPEVAVTINDEVYTSDQIGQLRGTARLGRRWAPYFGIGFGNPVRPQRRVTILFDLGIVIQGHPHLVLSATGPVANVPDVQEDLDAAAEKVHREHLDKSYLEIYPVLSFGAAVRLF